MKTLTQIQEKALSRMAEVRTGESRTIKNQGAALKQYRKEAAKLGYTDAQIEAQVKDLRDMHRLRVDAEPVEPDDRDICDPIADQRMDAADFARMGG